MENNRIIRTLKPGDKVKLTTLDARAFTGNVAGNGKQLWVAFQDGHGVTGFTIQASRLSRCLGTLEVLP